jgi:hypothetical protein
MRRSAGDFVQHRCQGATRQGEDGDVVGGEVDRVEVVNEAGEAGQPLANRRGPAGEDIDLDVAPAVQRG